MSLALSEHPDGVETEPGNRIVYDLARNEAHFGAARDRWATRSSGSSTGVPGAGRLDAPLRPRRLPARRCRVRHVHPGPGIRRLLFGELTIESPEGTQTYRAGESWLERAEHPVLATASSTEDTAFVRVLLLPAEWAGKRTIRYLDPADDEKPKLQRATILLEQPVEP